jgi:hypothetical protein
MLVADELAYDWDAANVSHIARHSVTPEEVEQCFSNDPMDVGGDVVEGEERYTKTSTRTFFVCSFWCGPCGVTLCVRSLPSMQVNVWQNVTWRKGDSEYDAER